jgi:hypothetical protein
VAKRWALIVAAGNPHYAGIGGPSHADADALAFASALAKIGIPAPQQIVLVGQDATKAVVDSRIRSLAKRLKRDDKLFVYFGMRAFVIRNELHLACWDTLPDEPQRTSFDAVEMMKLLSKNIDTPLISFVDYSAGPLIPTAMDGDVAIFDGENSVCGFASCSSGESSMAVGKPLRGLWMNLVVDALSGSHAAARDEKGRLTALSLDAFLRQEFPRKLRAAFGPGTVQTPTRFGSLSDVVLDESIQTSGHRADEFFSNAVGLARISFQGESRSKVKELSGYRKSFALPDRASASSNKFIARLAREEIDHDLGDAFNRVIREYGYKRKDLATNIDRDGVGTLRTPDLEYSITPTLDPDDPAFIVWSREIGQFSGLATVRTPAFDAAFGRVVDRLVFTFDVPLKVAALVDRLEDRPFTGMTIVPAPDGQSCVIRLSGTNGSILVETHSLTVRGRPGESGDLLTSLFAFFDSTGPLTDLPALSPKRPTRA